MKKQKNVLASVFLCLMLAFSTFAGETHGGGRECPPNTQCTQTVNPITNFVWYIWEILT